MSCFVWLFVLGYMFNSCYFCSRSEPRGNVAQELLTRRVPGTFVCLTRDIHLNRKMFSEAFWLLMLDNVSCSFLYSPSRNTEGRKCTRIAEFYDSGCKHRSSYTTRQRAETLTSLICLQESVFCPVKARQLWRQPLDTPWVVLCKGRRLNGAV